MARFCFQFWPYTYNNKTLPNGIIFCQSQFKICPKQNKLSQDCQALLKFRHFDKILSNLGTLTEPKFCCFVSQVATVVEATDSVIAAEGTHQAKGKNQALHCLT